MKIKIKAVLVGGAAAAAIAAALSGAGSANASCASLNGHDIGKGCDEHRRQRLGRIGPRRPGGSRQDLAASPSRSATPDSTGSIRPRPPLPTHADARAPATSPSRSATAPTRARWAPATTPSCWGRAPTPSPTAATRARRSLRGQPQHLGDGGRRQRGRGRGPGPQALYRFRQPQAGGGTTDGHTPVPPSSPSGVLTFAVAVEVPTTSCPRPRQTSLGRPWAPRSVGASGCC